jgi:Domain of unknown function (DUF4276)
VVSRERVTIYVEGGSPGDLQSECRKGFRLFLEKAGLKGQMPKVVACGSRNEAYSRFCTALSIKADFPLLLVDSEGPVSETPWQHALHQEGDQWKKPDGTDDDHLHFMVQVMESWFLADRAALKTHFGFEFKDSKLPKGKYLEAIPKQQVLDGLKTATQNCGRDKTYHKGRHSFEILGKISPQLVVAASPSAKRLIALLNSDSKS